MSWSENNMVNISTVIYKTWRSAKEPSFTGADYQEAMIILTVSQILSLNIVQTFIPFPWGKLWILQKRLILNMWIFLIWIFKEDP